MMWIQKGKFKSKQPDEIKKRFSCRHDGCLEGSSNSGSLSRHELNVTLHQTCTSKCQRCLDANTHLENKKDQACTAKRNCHTCPTEPELPTKLKDTTLPSNIDRLQQHLNKNPELQFDYNHIADFITNDDSKEQFIIECSRDGKSPPKIVPFRVYQKEFELSGQASTTATSTLQGIIRSC